MTQTTNRKKSPWVEFWYGELPLSAYKKIFPLFLSIQLLYLIIALFVKGHNFKTLSISGIGDPVYYPDTWWIFTVFTVMIGLMGFTYTRVMYRVLNCPVVFIKRIWAFLTILASIGSILVGIGNDAMIHQDSIHIGGAIFSFAGMLFAQLILFFIMLYNLVIHHKSVIVHRCYILIVTFVLLLGYILFEILQGISDGLLGNANLNPMEWLGMVFQLLMLVMFLWIQKEEYE